MLLLFLFCAWQALLSYCCCCRVRTEMYTGQAEAQGRPSFVYLCMEKLICQINRCEWLGMALNLLYLHFAIFQGASTTGVTSLGLNFWLWYADPCFNTGIFLCDVTALFLFCCGVIRFLQCSVSPLTPLIIPWYLFWKNSILSYCGTGADSCRFIRWVVQSKARYSCSRTVFCKIPLSILKGILFWFYNHVHSCNTAVLSRGARNKDMKS